MVELRFLIPAACVNSAAKGQPCQSTLSVQAAPVGTPAPPGYVEVLPAQVIPDPAG